MLKVAGIEDGIVIDHIQAGKGIHIFEKLNLDTKKTPVVLLMGVKSNRQGMKDIIKIEGIHDIDLDMLALIDKDITISHIRNGEITEKTGLNAPKSIQGIFECSNPRCISHVDSLAIPTFTLKKTNGALSYQCNYCEEITEYSL